MMNKVIISGSRTVIAALLMLFVTSVKAGVPELPTTVKVFRPSILKREIVKESELKALCEPPKKKKEATYGQDGVSTNEFWTVRSDRSNNKTYETPSLSGNPCGSLGFGEEVRIAQIQNGFALVYREPRAPAYPNITRGQKGAECKGWIPMSHLLLWSNCPANEKGIYNKALIVGNIEKLRDQGELTVGRYFSNPEETKNGESLNSTPRFYFVMKKDPDTNMHLLANYTKTGGKIKNTLFGWVSEGMYAPWSQRTCLERNWKKKDLESMTNKRIPVGKLNVVKSKKTTTASLSEVAMYVTLGNKNSLSVPESQKYRQSPYTLRFPLLGNRTDVGYYNITAFSSIKGEEESMSVDDKAHANEEILKSLDNMRQVNLIFVLDATSESRNFYTDIQSVINNVTGRNDYFGKDGRNVRVGLVLYRETGDSPEFLPLGKPGDTKLSGWLKKGGTKGFVSTPSEYRALFAALDIALDAKRMGYNKDQSTLMFVIGDRGNDPANSDSQDQIIKKCVENRIQLTSFCTRNIDAKPYTSFRRQMSQIVIGNMDKQYVALGEEAKHPYKKLDDGYDFDPDKVNNNTTFYVGSFRYAKDGQTMEKQQLQSLMFMTSLKVNAAIEKQEALTVHIEQTGITSSTSSVEKNFLSSRLSKHTIDVLNKSKFQLSFEGYTPYKDDYGVDYWQPVIYISKEELNQLMVQLKHVMDGIDKQSDDREPYVEAMKALAATMVGDVTEDALLKMGNEEIMNMITGLNVKSEALNYPLIDIQNKKKVSPQKFRELTSRFEEQYKKLEGIKTKYAFSYTDANGTVWYWIPAEDLP